MDILKIFRRIKRGEITNKEWARAIALRISDEWIGQDDEEDKALLLECLTSAFEERPDLVDKLIGIGIIEEDYFDDTD